MAPGVTARPVRQRAVALLVLVVACGTPVGVKLRNPRDVHRDLVRNVLSSDEPSAPTKNILYRRSLTERFDADPAGAIKELHEIAVGPRGVRSDLFALAELCFLQGEETRQHAYHLAAAIYANAFLAPSDPKQRVEPIDPRLRAAADIYNRGVAQGFETVRGEFTPRAGSWQLPFGTLDVDFDPQELVWGQRKLVRFVPVAELEVKGIPTRYRAPGIGAPLAAATEPLDPATGFDDFVEPWIRVPITALLRIRDPQAQLATGHVSARLTLERAQEFPRVKIAHGRTVPLEVETTASLALTLAESPIWAQEIGGFFQRAGLVNEKTRLAALMPYRPGRVPIVLVHGTASSPGRWAQMINELTNDRRIGPYVTFWLFMYDTGNPIPYSAMLLRESLAKAIARLDPDGRDPALRRMIVIGHSQGGLLTKMTVVDSGDRFWTNISDAPFDTIDLDPEQRDLARRALFIEPLPFVRRVIFLSTPQRGSYVAGSWIAQQVARLITMPLDLTRVATDMLRRNPKLRRSSQPTRLQTSVDQMTPGNPFIKTLADLPIAPGVSVHSIVAVQGEAPYDDLDDGVVEYRSAHLENATSELVVHSGHSCQDDPHTIDEVRRIVAEHLAEVPPPEGTPAPSSRRGPRYFGAERRPRPPPTRVFADRHGVELLRDLSRGGGGAPRLDGVHGGWPVARASASRLPKEVS
jgi:pimeloyl-ACP methyl ester carboxylesterase